MLIVNKAFRFISFDHGTRSAIQVQQQGNEEEEQQDPTNNGVVDQDACLERISTKGESVGHLLLARCHDLFIHWHLFIFYFDAEMNLAYVLYYYYY
jgi:hypothetical protein